jgi:hypothetical protein
MSDSGSEVCTTVRADRKGRRHGCGEGGGGLHPPLEYGVATQLGSQFPSFNLANDDLKVLKSSEKGPSLQ